MSESYDQRFGERVMENQVKQNPSDQTMHFIKKMPLWIVLYIRWFGKDPAESDDFNFMATAQLCKSLISFLPTKNFFARRVVRELEEWSTAFTAFAVICQAKNFALTDLNGKSVVVVVRQDEAKNESKDKKNKTNYYSNN